MKSEKTFRVLQRSRHREWDVVVVEERESPSIFYWEATRNGEGFFVTVSGKDPYFSLEDAMNTAFRCLDGFRG